MLVHWMMDGDGLHYAARLLGARGTLHMQVDSLGESGWDWHVWEQLDRGQQRYGLADTLDEAKAKAENALDGLARELRLTA
jgi:hypothetical protein